MHRIRELTPLTYRLAMGELRTALSDRCLRGAGAVILGCFSDADEPEGFAIFRVSDGICTVNDLRAGSDEAEEALLTAVVERCASASVNGIHRFTDAPCPPRGWSVAKRTKVYRVDGRLSPLWTEFRAKLRPIADRYAARGCITVPLGECTAEQRQEIIAAYRAFRDSGYMEALLEGSRGELLQKLSTVVLKDGHVAAYCLLHADPNSPNDCQLGYLGCARGFYGTCVMASALIGAVDAYLQSDFRSLRFIIDETNRDSGSLVERHFPSVQPKVTISDYYRELPERTIR